jgi:predicted TIM-barrel fold metal-dependent hydrolase
MAPAEGLMGSAHFDPIYDACSEVGLPLVVHFSGVEGRYLGAPTLAGGVHYSALARHVLMPHLAESNLTSLVFEGTFEKFPRLQVLFAGFGFVWLMPLVWRLDREWRTFRHDVPWVRRPPSTYLAEHAWFTSHPIEEAVDAGVWARAGFSDEFADRIVFGSHAPFEPDSSADVTRVLGPERGERLLRAGSALLATSAVGGKADGE